jgi:UDP:flavonoid glycosyltransferase YjiC (YdhE family)
MPKQLQTHYILHENEAVERVANEVSFRERAQSMQRITREAGGYQRAVDAIIRFAEERAKAH